MWKKLIILIFGLLSCGCGNIDYKEIMNNNEYIIVDVRTKEEYNESHLVDAVNIAYDEINEDSLDINKIIFVYCFSGRRSKMAYDYLTGLGYRVYDLGAFNEIDLPKE